MTDKPAGTRPKNAIVVLLDSLNRHMLGAYGGSEFDTPNLDAFAARTNRFMNHYTGALPCMPARHDILCGALDFLWKPWGSIELWEDAITVPLRHDGVTTMLISDHPHLFEVGGENYHVDFNAWEYLRGHESDPWKTRPDPSWLGSPGFGRGMTNYDRSRGWFHNREEEFPGPKTMQHAVDWVDDNAGHHDRFFLFIDEFDPHEPFDTPEPYASMYDKEWEGDHLIWPPYKQGAIADGTITEREGFQIRASYGAKLTMIDHWFGKLIDAVSRNNLWQDTMIILCTDHGHYLGEKDIWGKPGVPIYQTLGHTPLFIHWPGSGGAEIEALSTNVDIFATIADLFSAEVRQRTHGKSLLPLLEGTAPSVRDWLLTGIWGREVHVVDGTHKYVRGTNTDNAPISMWSNRWSTMPIWRPGIKQHTLLPLPDDRAVLDKMPGSDVPVIRQPWDAEDRLPYWARSSTENLLFNLEDDPDEEHDLSGTGEEEHFVDMLREILRDMDAPDDQFERLQLT